MAPSFETFPLPPPPRAIHQEAWMTPPLHHSADMEIKAENKASLFPLASMPEDCLSLTLSHCSPRDIARLGAVSKTWKAAAQGGKALSSARRGEMLKYHFELDFPLLQKAAALSSQAAAELAIQGVHSTDKSWLLTTDPITGQMSLHASVAKVLDLWWADGHGPVIREHQIRGQVQGSDFASCACVVNAQFFELFGEVRPPFSVPPGWYAVSWKVAKTHRFTWSLRPALSSFHLIDRSGRSFVRHVSHQESVGDGSVSADSCPFTNLELAHLEEVFEAGKTRVVLQDDMPKPLSLAIGRRCELRDVGLDFRFPGKPVRERVPTANKEQSRVIGSQASAARLVQETTREARIAAAIPEGVNRGSPGPIQWETYTVGEVYLADIGDLRAKVAAHVSLKVSWFHRTISGLYIDSLILTKLD